MNNAPLTLSCPSKTFICGEYLVLASGPALVVNTQPRFELIVMPRTTDQSAGFPISSPAYKLLQDQAELLQNCQLEFKDPHEGRGGFGASSAQFLLLAKLIGEIPQLLETYHHYSWNGEGIKPSGADIIAQLSGQITYYHPIENQIETFAWPFADIDFLLLRTQNKIATHDHLNVLSQTKIHSFALVATPVMQTIMTACAEKNSAQFIQGINAFAEALKQHDLVTSTTQEFLNKLYGQEFCLAAKGCGAMGADVILVLCDREKMQILKQWCMEQSLEVVATNEDICGGLEVKNAMA